MQPTTTYIALTGTVIARLRRLAGLQQAEIAPLVGVNQSSWSKIERGSTAATIEYLAVLAPVLKAEPHEVLTAVHHVVRAAEARGIQVFRQRAEMPADALLGQLSARALVALVEAALASPTDSPAAADAALAQGQP